MKLARIALTPSIAAISVFAFFALTLSTFGFDYSSTITASGYAGEETLQNFPVLVKISPTTIKGFDYSQLKNGNADIAFVSLDGGTEYPFEIDTWDTSGTSFVWVKLPELTAATQFKFLWGDESVTASAANAHAVWGSAAGGSYLGVWHMNGGDGADEVDSAGTVTDVDMTFTAMAGTGGDTSRMTSVAAMIGTGRSIDSKNATKDKLFPLFRLCERRHGDDFHDLLLGASVCHCRMARHPRSPKHRGRGQEVAHPSAERPPILVL